MNTMHKKILFLTVLALYYLPAGAQYYNQQSDFLKANSVWAFGIGAGLDFNSGSPVPIQTSLRGYEGCASVADTAGQLLFYLGGEGVIWNRNHTGMLNSVGLYPYHSVRNGASSAQGAVIVPVIDTPWKYYVFINTQEEGYHDAGASRSSPPYLSYSVVDMTLDNGLGGVEPGRKNIPLYNYGLLEAMIAIPGDNCDIWLMTVSGKWQGIPADPKIPADTQFFMTWHITPNGIDPNPVLSNPHPALNEHDIQGNMLAVAPNRQSMALSLRGKGALLCKFNPATGRVADGLILPVGVPLFNYAPCFSPDNTKLYITSEGQHIIRQYDVSTYNTAAIMSSEYLVATGSYWALKLYRDTIFALLYDLTAPGIHTINNPNASGAACNFYRKAVPAFLPNTSAVLGLPNEVVFPAVRYESFTVHDTICYSEERGYASKMLSAPSGFAFYEWDNGATGSSREATAPGTYWVRYRNNSCFNYTDTFLIEATDLTFSLGEDKTMLFCDQPQSYLQLEVNIPHAGYRWQDGSSGSRYRVTQLGTYWVEVSKGGCTVSDTIQIHGVALDLPDTTVCEGDPVDITFSLPPVPTGTIIQWSTGSAAPAVHVTDTGLYWVSLIYPPCILSDTMHIGTKICGGADTSSGPDMPSARECFVRVPDAFTPNGDGVNDYFRPVIEAGCPVSAYAISIYNRFGERVFHSADPGKGWDGRYKGTPADLGTYFYELHFTGRIRGKQYYYKGDLVLLR